MLHELELIAQLLSSDLTVGFRVLGSIDQQAFLFYLDNNLDGVMEEGMTFTIGEVCFVLATHFYVCRSLRINGEQEPGNTASQNQG